MKLVVCLECGDFFSPGEDKPKACKCGYSCAQWKDPHAGTLNVSSRWHQDHLRVVGISNTMLSASLKDPALDDDGWRVFVDNVVTNCPGYLFDKSRRNCPILFIRVGESNDVFFEKDLILEIPWKKEDRIAALEAELEKLRA